VSTVVSADIVVPSSRNQLLAKFVPNACRSWDLDAPVLGITFCQFGLRAAL
jgi:hypothetical protein